MNFITKKALPRRLFLRGMGTALALPMLDSMMPALKAAAAAPPRLGWVYASHGVIFDQWKPTTVGAFELTPNLMPMKNLVGRFNVLTGLSHLEAIKRARNIALLPIAGTHVLP